MVRSVFLSPVSDNTGLTTVSLGVVNAIEQTGTRVVFFKPVAEKTSETDDGTDLSTAILGNACNVPTIPPLQQDYVETQIAQNNSDGLLEEIIERIETHRGDAQIIIVEGMVPNREIPFANRLNLEIARTLASDVVFVGKPGNHGAEGILERVKIAGTYFGGKNGCKISGCIINKVAPRENADVTVPLIANSVAPVTMVTAEQLQEKFAGTNIRLLGTIPWSRSVNAPRSSDLAQYLNARVINEGHSATRRIRNILMYAATLSKNEFRSGNLIVTPGDRSDILVAASLAAMNGVDLAGVILNDNQLPGSDIMELCEEAMARGLPVFASTEDTWTTARLLRNFNLALPLDDVERIRLSRDHAAEQLDNEWIQSLILETHGERLLSPPAFRYQLTEQAREANQCIVLPEGDEPRTIQAAAICAERNIARCILIGDRDTILRVAEKRGVTLPEGVTILDPERERKKYIEPLVKLREHKGLTALTAEDHLQDNVVLGTMMLQQDEVDGLVSGAVHTTANTIRPALQLIRTAAGASLVSSIFFMLLPDQVLVYGDCAINPDPTAEQLCDIAIQSADSAAAFGIVPRVAMISYSTGASGTGSDVEKVRTATQLVREKRPDIIVDGPLQYDAAIMENVAKSKSPDSPVAGKATVFVFPDLNTGNTTYKAVQRSAHLTSIGPMLQGLAKPVNDLSRGALVDDIVYTIALTAIQAARKKL
ncbi:MAG: phosphate acetyltransferase [Halioglobus sp.]